MWGLPRLDDAGDFAAAQYIPALRRAFSATLAHLFSLQTPVLTESPEKSRIVAALLAEGVADSLAALWEKMAQDTEGSAAPQVCGRGGNFVLSAEC